AVQLDIVGRGDVRIVVASEEREAGGPQPAHGSVHLLIESIELIEVLVPPQGAAIPAGELRPGREVFELTERHDLEQLIALRGSRRGRRVRQRDVGVVNGGYGDPGS